MFRVTPCIAPCPECYSRCDGSRSTMSVEVFDGSRVLESRLEKLLEVQLHSLALHLYKYWETIYYFILQVKCSSSDFLRGEVKRTARKTTGLPVRHDERTDKKIERRMCHRYKSCTHTYVRNSFSAVCCNRGRCKGENCASSGDLRPRQGHNTRWKQHRKTRYCIRSISAEDELVKKLKIEMKISMSKE